MNDVTVTHNNAPRPLELINSRKTTPAGETLAVYPVHCSTKQFAQYLRDMGDFILTVVTPDSSEDILTATSDVDYE